MWVCYTPDVPTGRIRLHSGFATHPTSLRDVFVCIRGGCYTPGVPDGTYSFALGGVATHPTSLTGRDYFFNAWLVWGNGPDRDHRWVAFNVGRECVPLGTPGVHPKQSAG
jgi:hypothetical protein